ncbi:hypothetical protein SAMN02745126_01537 [Enhydrobacter aerosaccus]|uniref:DUF5132 domain-containing protein n=1 Tax=Enhydrobacter aerosaccus TaxID=225324 RepID=A0A1T4LG99_9HYPH|nr:DUF5132 domain-containing protein [Enhydrobacter aerosaccus]SJZ53772.1 hypothetical protein SAMN02745126_01537 [Enhydrobacter aerosaccus]
MTSSAFNGHAEQDIGASAEATGGIGSDNVEVKDDVNDAVTAVATVGAVAVGAALVEVALLPGIALGVAAMLAPKYVPKMGSALAPVFRSSVRGVYKFGQKTREVVAEAKEQVNDIVAEVQAEEDEAPKAATASAAPATPAAEPAAPRPESTRA